MRNLRSHKTDRKDAKWITGLVRHGLIRPRFVPRLEFRDARELTRTRRNLIQARTAIRNEITRLEAVEEDIHRIEKLITQQLQPYAEQRTLLVTIPGISHISACILIAGLGVDMSPWPSQAHLSAWCGVAPGCRESGGKTHRAPTRKGNPYVCTTLVECAGTASRTRDSHLADTYRRLCARTGSKMKAKVALAHKIAIIVYHVLNRMEPFNEPSSQNSDPARHQRAIRKHLRELQRLGYHLTPTHDC